MRIVCNFIGIILLVVLSACATKIEGLQANPDFTYPAILQGKIIVGGVVDSVGTLSEGQRMQLAETMRYKLNEECPDYQVMPAGHVVDVLGQQQYINMLAFYLQNGVISSDDVQKLRTSLPDIRYVVFANLTKNKVEKSDNQYESDVYEDGKKKKKKVQVNTNYQTCRKVSVAMMILDLSSGSSAWSGYVDKDSCNTNNQQQVYKKDDRWKDELLTGVVETVASALLNQKKDPYPEAPGLQDLVGNAFSGFGENLPYPRK